MVIRLLIAIPAVLLFALCILLAIGLTKWWRLEDMSEEERLDTLQRWGGDY